METNWSVTDELMAPNNKQSEIQQGIKASGLIRSYAKDTDFIFDLAFCKSFTKFPQYMVKQSENMNFNLD